MNGSTMHRNNVYVTRDYSTVLENLSDQLKKFNVHSLLFVYSGDFIKALGIWDKVKQTCEQNDIHFYSNGNVVPNPKVELVRELISLGKEKILTLFWPAVEEAL